MPHTRDRAVMKWIVSFASVAVVLVVLGGFVRLMQAGLSIVEWKPFEGAIPPLTQAAWLSEFAKYQQSPEYQQINRGMTVVAYQEIFLIEWFHRLACTPGGPGICDPFLRIHDSSADPNSRSASVHRDGHPFSRPRRSWAGSWCRLASSTVLR